MLKTLFNLFWQEKDQGNQQQLVAQSLVLNNFVEKDTRSSYSNKRDQEEAAQTTALAGFLIAEGNNLLNQKGGQFHTRSNRELKFAQPISTRGIIYSLISKNLKILLDIRCLNNPGKNNKK